jgi:hypothetical protein
MLLDLIILIIFGEVYTLWISSLWSWNWCLRNSACLNTWNFFT